MTPDEIWAEWVQSRNLQDLDEDPDFRPLIEGTAGYRLLALSRQANALLPGLGDRLLQDYRTLQNQRLAASLRESGNDVVADIIESSD